MLIIIIRRDTPHVDREIEVRMPGLSLGVRFGA